MILQTLAILIFFTVYSTTLPNPQNPTSLSSPKLLNPHRKKPISFSTRVYNKRGFINQISSNTSAFSNSKLQLDLHPFPDHNLVMVVGIGRNRTSMPMLTTELLVDTGSSLTWLQAFPCDKCYAQGDFPFYNSSASKTFDPSYCYDEICNTIDDAIPQCRNSSWPLGDPCVYQIQYYDGSNTTGVIGTETFYFQDASEIGNTVEYVPFGLGTSNYQSSHFDDFTPGVAGLGRGYGTLLNRLGVKKFSHCFPRNEEDTGILRFGGAARIMGDKLALDKTSMHYMAPLTNVYLAGEWIPMENDALPEKMVFDTGTPWSILSPKVFDAIIEAISIALGKYNPLRNANNHICYKLMDLYSVDLDEVAKVTFEFRYSTKIDLFSFQLWKFNDEHNLICLGFHRGNPGELIFGNHLMREVNIGYTLDEDDLAMYFNRQHCST